ncbi:response regulator transcription factor [Paenibacillus sp. FSL R7-0331]|uniref:response regulator transcription factor n=1 Tax=Paenibacillus sp. FSL R7-0331 TaxID=1536773 RepID=UPI0004F8B3B3|nr:response regulator transcription factor [Paenibacillus sp. FSL R7-0331]AIQ53974.1 heme response regulator HssR [Paenibacillus sp. FSL R7-0331]
MINILVVEDNGKLRQLIGTVLAKHGYNPVLAEDGQHALALLDTQHIDLIISDIMMPNVDGYELTGRLRDAGYNTPVLMVTAKESFEDKQRGYLAGTDDYMVKPIDVNEMILRVGALLRRAKIVSERRLGIGELILNYDSLTVHRGDRSALLPQKEFFLLYKLLSYPNKIFTRQQLMDEIWGMDSETDARTVDVHINRLRERFKDCPEFEIVTVRGLGYKAVKHL